MYGLQKNPPNSCLCYILCKEHQISKENFFRCTVAIGLGFEAGEICFAANFITHYFCSKLMDK